MSWLRRLLSGIELSRKGLAKEDDMSDLDAPQDFIILGLYREAAEIEGVSLREFMLKYGLARKKSA